MKHRKAKKKDPNRYPKGWDYARAQSVAKFYDDRKDEVFFDDYEVLMPEPTTWIAVPTKLLPRVQKLLKASKKVA